MCDPENFMAQERAEGREARERSVGAPRQLRDPYTGEWRDVPSRAEAERDEKEGRRGR
jgi:hypothetical protein